MIYLRYLPTEAGLDIKRNDETIAKLEFQGARVALRHGFRRMAADELRAIAGFVAEAQPKAPAAARTVELLACAAG